MAKLNSRKKKIVLLASLAVVLVAVASFFLIKHFTKPEVPTTPSGVKLAPPTDQEKKDAEDNKEKILQEQQNNQNQTSGKKQVNVIITNASPDSVNAFVSGIFEEGGTCTATFSQGSTVITRTSQGFGNASYTQCAPITPNLPNSSGWSVTVSYSSNSAEGSSAAKAF